MELEMKLDFPVYVIFYKCQLKDRQGVITPKHIKVGFDFYDDQDKPFLYKKRGAKISHANKNEEWNKKPFHSYIVNSARMRIGENFVKKFFEKNGNVVSDLIVTSEWIYREGVNFNVPYNDNGFLWENVGKLAEIKLFYPTAESLTLAFDVFAKNKFEYKEKKPILDSAAPKHNIKALSDTFGHVEILRAHEYLKNRKLVPIRLLFNAPNGDIAELNVCLKKQEG